MPKTRMTALDVRACVNELKATVLGSKVVNIYDVSNKVYVIKSVRGGIQHNILIESGVRIHATNYLRDKNRFPSAFALKLRKHIRNRRIEAVRQIGFDRVVDLVFGNGETTYHVILELYAGGNIILTDYKFEILALLRVYKLADGTEVNIRQRYDIQPKQHSPFETIAAMTTDTMSELVSFFSSRWSELKSKEKQLKNVLLTNNSFALIGGAYVSNALRAQQLDPASTTALMDRLQDASAQEALLTQLKKEATAVEEALRQPKGYILRQASAQVEGSTAEPYVDYCPFPLQTSGDESCVEFKSFNEALDAYYTNEESVKLVQKLAKARENIDKKVSTIVEKQDMRVRALQDEIAALQRRINVLFRHPDVVNTAIVVINQYLSQGVQWNVLEEQVKLFKQKPYNVFHHIQSLDLEHNRIRLQFDDDEDDEEYDEDSEEDSEEEVVPRERKVSVEVDLSCNCNNNIAMLYAQKKELNDKLEKTQVAAEQAVKEANKQRESELKVAERTQPAEIARRRQKRWFEKFDWFVTSEDYIVVAGRSGEQNELLVRKYLRKGDIFMHADVHGAATVIIRNYMSVPSDLTLDKCPHSAVSLISLQQAAVFSLCHSVSWDNNLINKVYWVYSHQVSKTAPTGEYLPTGSFMIRGRKNYMTPMCLDMGLCLLFQVSEENLASHRYERRRRDLSNEEWDEVIAKGCVSGVETAADKLVEDEGVEDDEDDEDYSIEVMDTVTTTSKKAKPVVRSQPRKVDPKGSKKSLKGTTKKSRLAAEEAAEMEALAQAEEEKLKARSKEPSRSERRKQKKAKKYEGRDAEDKKLLDVLYGHASVDSILRDIKPKAEKTPAVAEKTEADPNDPAAALLRELMDAETSPSEETPMCYTCGSHDHEQKQCPESWRVIEGIEDGAVEKEDAKEEGKEEKEEDEQPVETKEEQRDTGDFLLDWTYTPHPEDTILHAIPVCAPYMAISSYPFRVKLTSGKAKKGAMAKSIVEMWLKSKVSEAEKRVIKLLPIEDISATIMNNSKAVLSGGAKGKK